MSEIIFENLDYFAITLDSEDPNTSVRTINYDGYDVVINNEHSSVFIE